MSTITLPNIRVSSDLTVELKLKDGGVAIDWSTLSNIRVCIYSDVQHALAGRCTVAIDETDSTVLVCQYAANKPQYLGVNRVIVQATYMGETKTYDKPALNFVRWTEDQEGEEITITDPDIDVEIEVEDVSSSILQEAIDAALNAAADAEHAAHLIPNQVLLDCEQATADANEAAATASAAGIDQVTATVDANVGTPSVDVSLADKHLTLGFHNMKGMTGDAAGFGTVGATVDANVGTPAVSVSTSGPDTAKNISFAFSNLKGEKGDKGDQGNTGSSVDYPYELVNNLTTNDSTKGLSAAMGVQLEGEVSQLELKVIEESGGQYTPELTIEQGAIASATGTDTASTTRLRTANYIYADTISITTSGNKVYVMGYAENGTYISAKGWLPTSQDVHIAGAVKYRFVFAFSNDATIVPSDFSSLEISVVASFDGEFATKDELESNTNYIEEQTASEYGFYGDNGGKISTSNELSYTPLIPIKNGQVINFSGNVSSAGHGLLIYSDENTVIDTAFTDGVFENAVYNVTRDNAKFVRCQGRTPNYSPEVSASHIRILTHIKQSINDLRTGLLQRTVISNAIATSQATYVYADDGTRLASSNYNGTTNGLIPVILGDKIEFTGILPATRHGLLLYSDENTIVDAAFINGTFNGAIYTVSNASIKYFRAQAFNSNYDPSITTQLSVTVLTELSDKVKNLSNQVEELTQESASIIITKISSGVFDVKILQKSNGKYLTHRFLRQNYSRMVRYGSSGEATHSEVCADCWFPSSIHDGETEILQGNANFINYVNKTNELSYAGEGHGATITAYTHFFADGVEFDPNSLTTELKCNSFRIVEKNIIYAIDTTQPNFNSDNAIPYFNENGDKVVSTIHWLEGVYVPDNSIKYRHRLTVMRDNTQFYYCFGAMLEMEKDLFTNIIINNAEGTENTISYSIDNAQWTHTPINGSAVTLTENTSYKGDEIIGFGTKYLVRQRMLQALTSRNHKSSMFPRFYTGGSYRVKFYQQPIVTLNNASVMGESAETFNAGDTIELFCERKIDFVE